METLENMLLNTIMTKSACAIILSIVLFTIIITSVKAATITELSILVIAMPISIQW